MIWKHQGFSIKYMELDDVQSMLIHAVSFQLESSPADSWMLRERELQ